MTKLVMKIGIVAKLTSGGGQGKIQHDALVTALQARSALCEHQSFITLKPSDGGARIADALKFGADMIVVIGGDGTLSECVHALFSLNEKDMQAAEVATTSTAAPTATAASEREVQHPESAPSAAIATTNGEAKSLPPVVYIAAGTGSDFSKLGYSALTAEDAAKAIFEGGRETLADVGFVCSLAPSAVGPEQNTLRYFINIASLGLGASVVDRAERYKQGCCGKCGGGCVFCCASLGGLLCSDQLDVKFRPIDDAAVLAIEPQAHQLTIDPRDISTVKKAVERADAANLPFIARQVTSLAFCNGQYFGAGMKISPASKIDDGILNLTSISAGVCSFVCGLSSVYNGEATKWSSSKLLAGTCFEAVIAEDPNKSGKQVDARFEIDGEIGPSLPAVIGIVPERKLRLRSPPVQTTTK